MDVRIWGELEDRLIEVRVEPASGPTGLGVEGLPERAARTTADRVRAAILNSGLRDEAPYVRVRLLPAVFAGPTSLLDLPIALAALVDTGSIDTGLRWILASGRLGLDGSVHGAYPAVRSTLSDVLRSVCRTPSV